MPTDGLTLLHEVADAVHEVFAAVVDLGPSGRRDGQYAFDVETNEVALAVLRRAGVGILSEESDTEPGSGTRGTVVIDPIDGSTNASRGVPWYATALCLVDGDGPAVALVANHASGRRFWAVRGGGAFCDGVPLAPSGCTAIGEAIVGLNGLPPRPLGTQQVRMLGAASLDLCAVAEGVLDGYVDCATEAHGLWDYLASVLVCREAGVPVVDAFGRDLVVLDRTARRTPVAAATPQLLDALLAARQATVGGG